MSVKVVCRVRPPSAREAPESRESKKMIVVEDNEVVLWRPVAPVRFKFDHALDGAQTQRDVFELVRPLMEEVLEGYEATVFAYGQTGTGKTHTMMGELRMKKLRGVIPRAAEYLCEMCKNPSLKQATMWVSFLEIYNEELTDLLSLGNRLQIQEHGVQGTVCKNLSQHVVKNVDEVMEFLLLAQERQKVSETKMNKVSSRSHCIFTIKLRTEKQLKSGDIVRCRGKLHLVDLAGSECGKSAGGGPIQERERKNINQSLLTLGRVIGALKGKSGGKLRIPYRDSKLTRLLKESLGGRCKTVLIATLSPSHHHMEETLSTLLYAQNALGVVNTPVRNQQLDRLYSGLSAEIQNQLKEALFSPRADSLPIHEQLDKALATLVDQRCPSLPKEEEMQKQLDRMIEKNVQEHFRSLEEANREDVHASEVPRTPLSFFDANFDSLSKFADELIASSEHQHDQQIACADELTRESNSILRDFMVHHSNILPSAFEPPMRRRGGVLCERTNKPKSSVVTRGDDEDDGIMLRPGGVDEEEKENYFYRSDSVGHHLPVVLEHEDGDATASCHDGWVSPLRKKRTAVTTASDSHVANSLPSMTVMTQATQRQHQEVRANGEQESSDVDCGEATGGGEKRDGYTRASVNFARHVKDATVTRAPVRAIAPCDEADIPNQRKPCADEVSIKKRPLGAPMLAITHQVNSITQPTTARKIATPPLRKGVTRVTRAPHITSPLMASRVVLPSIAQRVDPQKDPRPSMDARVLGYTLAARGGGLHKNTRATASTAAVAAATGGICGVGSSSSSSSKVKDGGTSLGSKTCAHMKGDAASHKMPSRKTRGAHPISTEKNDRMVVVGKRISLFEEEPAPTSVTTARCECNSSISHHKAPVRPSLSRPANPSVRRISISLDIPSERHRRNSASCTISLFDEGYACGTQECPCAPSANNHNTPQRHARAGVAESPYASSTSSMSHNVCSPPSLKPPRLLDMVAPPAKSGPASSSSSSSCTSDISSSRSPPGGQIWKPLRPSATESTASVASHARAQEGESSASVISTPQRDKSAAAFLGTTEEGVCARSVRQPAAATGTKGAAAGPIRRNSRPNAVSRSVSSSSSSVTWSVLAAVAEDNSQEQEKDTSRAPCMAMPKDDVAQSLRKLPGAYQRPRVASAPNVAQSLRRLSGMHQRPRVASDPNIAQSLRRLSGMQQQRLRAASEPNIAQSLRRLSGMQ